MEDLMIYESDIKDYFFNKLVKAGLSPGVEEVEVIASIVMDYLIDIGIVDPQSVVYIDEVEENE